MLKASQPRLRLTLVATVGKNLEDVVVVLAVRRAEVQRLDPEDLDEGLLDALELARDLGVALALEVGVRPGVRTESVATVVQVLDLVGAVVNAAVVVAVEEEGRASTLGLELAGNVLLPEVGAVCWESARSSGASGASDVSIALVHPVRRGCWWLRKCRSRFVNHTLLL